MPHDLLVDAVAPAETGSPEHVSAPHNPWRCLDASHASGTEPCDRCVSFLGMHLGARRTLSSQGVLKIIWRPSVQSPVAIARAGGFDMPCARRRDRLSLRDPSTGSDGDGARQSEYWSANSWCCSGALLLQAQPMRHRSCSMVIWDVRTVCASSRWPPERSPRPYPMTCLCGGRPVYPSLCACLASCVGPWTQARRSSGHSFSRLPNGPAPMPGPRR